MQDLKTEEYAYKDGMNQGDPTAPVKWIWFIDPLYPTIRESMEGADLQNGATVKTAGFADDTFLVSSGPRALQDLAAGGRACESDAQRRRYAWDEGKKRRLVCLGPGTGQGATVNINRKPVKERPTLRVLGYMVGSSKRGPHQRDLWRHVYIRHE